MRADTVPSMVESCSVPWKTQSPALFLAAAGDRELAPSCRRTCRCGCRPSRGRPSSVPLIWPFSTCSVAVMLTSPCGCLDDRGSTFHRRRCLSLSQRPAFFFSSSVGSFASRPSTKTCFTFASLSKIALSVTTTLAILPLSSEPSWRSMPTMRGGIDGGRAQCVIGGEAVLDRLADAGKKSLVLPAPLTSANSTPLFASTEGVVGASWRSRMTRSGCSSRSSFAAGAAPTSRRPAPARRAT